MYGPSNPGGRSATVGTHGTTKVSASGSVKLFGKTPRICVTMEGIQVGAIADSGAEVSLVTEAWYKEWLLPRQVVVHGMDVQVTDAKGTEIPCIGYVRVDLEVEGQLIKDCGLFVKGADQSEGVVQGTKLPVLLGMNVLAELVRGWRSTCGENLQPELHGKWGKCVRAVEARLRALDQSLGWAVVHQEQQLVIPAGTRRVVRVFLRNLKEIDQESVLLEPLEEEDGCWVPNGVCVFPSYTKVVHGRGWLSVANLGTIDVKLRPQWIVAKVSYGREVKKVGVSSHTTEKIEPPEKAREFRRRLGVHVDESTVDASLLCQLDQLLYRYKGVFAEDEQELGCATGVEHEVHLTSEVPIRLPYRHISPLLMPEVKAHVKGLVEQGVIEESVSPYAAPIVVVRKKDGSLRLCVDYRRLNEVTVKDAFPLPRIQDTLDSLAGAQYFSSFDLAAGYHQIKVRKEDRPKTAFVTPFGHYQYVRCPMGMTNSPATFQRFMEYVFSDQIFVTLLVYLDDLLVFSHSEEEHLERMGTVLGLLEKHGLKLKPSKCYLLTPQVKYLGFVISRNGIGTDPEKVQAIKEWPIPRTVKEVRGFVAFCSFYRRFIEGFAKVAAPLHALMGGQSKEEITHYWGPAEQAAFEQLKEKMVQAPVLRSADYTKQFVVETDASFDGLGAVLSQMHDGKLHPVAYASRGLRRSERNMANYSSRKLELLALKWAVTEQFKNYLAGGQFLVLTDNNPLVHLKTAKLGAVESRWLGDLNRFKFVVKYRPGKENANADGLSRRPHQVESEDDEGEVTEIWEKTGGQVAVMNIWERVNLDQMRDEQKACPAVGKLWLQMTGQWKPGELRNCLKSEEFRKLWRVRKALIMRGGVIYWRGARRDRMLPVLPVDKRKEVMCAAHEQWGHQGVARTTSLLRDRFFWPGLYEDVNQHVARCKRCAMGKEEGLRSKTRLGTVEASKPWQVLAMDFTLLDPARDGKENVLIVTDVFSKFAFAFPTKNQKATTVAKILVEEIFNRFGIPERLHSDQGRNFEGQLVQSLCEHYRVDKSRTTPYHPEGNGGCERFNRTLHGMLATLGEEQREQWPRYLASLTAIYNSTPHPVTGFSPHFIVFGMEPHLPLDKFSLGREEAVRSHGQWIHKLKETQQKAWEVAKQNMQNYREGNRRKRQEQGRGIPLEVGQQVLLKKNQVLGRNKIQPKYAEEVWVVIDVLDQVSGVYKVKSQGEPGLEKVLHRSNLRPWGGSGEDGLEGSGDKEDAPTPAQETTGDEEPVEMPDMEEVLRRFNIRIEDSPGIGEQEFEGDVAEDENMVLDPPVGLRDDRKVQESSWNLDAPEFVSTRIGDDDASNGETTFTKTAHGGRLEEEDGEGLTTLRRSKRIADRANRGWAECIMCGECVRGGQHKVSGAECNNGNESVG